MALPEVISKQLKKEKKRNNCDCHKVFCHNSSQLETILQLQERPVLAQDCKC